MYTNDVLMIQWKQELYQSILNPIKVDADQGWCRSRSMSVKVDAGRCRCRWKSMPVKIKVDARQRRWRRSMPVKVKLKLRVICFYLTFPQAFVLNYRLFSLRFPLENHGLWKIRNFSNFSASLTIYFKTANSATMDIMTSVTISVHRPR